MNEMERTLAQLLVSPEIHADHSVTFRLRAPRASRVQVVGLAGHPTLALQQRPDGGVWQGTCAPLTPDIYSYHFVVDGAMHLDPHNRQVKRWLMSDNMFEISGDPPRDYELQPVPHGAIHSRAYHSHTSGQEREAVIYVPAEYDADPARRFPTLVLLHGYGDDQTAWTEVGRAHRIADNLIAANAIEPTIVVMPYGHPLPIDLRVPFDDYAAENLKAMERDVLSELLPFIERHYRVDVAPQRRAIAGLSMGGGQSLAIGLANLQVFAWIGGFSSAVPLRGFDQHFPQLSVSPVEANQHIQKLWFRCGAEDFLLDRNTAFTQWLTATGIAHDYQQTTGGHDWTVWRRYLAEFLRECFPG